MPPRPSIVTPVAGQPGAMGFLNELKAWHDLETEWKVPDGASIAEVQDIVSDCEAEYDGPNGGGGIVAMSPGHYVWPAGSVLVEKTATSIIGPNSASTIIDYGGSDACFRWANDPTTVQQQGKLKGLTILGTSTGGGTGVHCFDTGVTPAFDDVVIYGFTGTGGIGLHLENDAIQNERLSVDRLHLDNNKIGMRLYSPEGNNQFSFGYARVGDLRLNVNNGQIGIQSEGWAFVYNGIWNVIGNGGGGTSTFFDIGNESRWDGPMMVVTGESFGVGANVRDSGYFNPSGLWSPGAPDVGEVYFGFTFSGKGQLRSNGGEGPSVAFGPNAGSVTVAPPAVVFGNSLRGHVTFGTGTPVAAGGLMVVTWQRAFPNTPWPPEIVITPLGRASAALRLYVDLVDDNTFTVGCDVAPAANQPNTAYGFSYHVIG